MKRFHSGPATDPHMVLLRVIQGGDEQEARRILAETEAPKPGAGHLVKHSKPLNLSPHHAAPFKGLAESLAAFIALPIE